MKQIPTNIIAKYREFDRESDSKNTNILAMGTYFPTNLNSLTEDIKANGFQEPFILTVFGSKALLTDGNHRLCSAMRLTIDTVPVNIENFNTIEDLSYKAYVEEKMVNAIEIDNELKNYL